MKAVNKYIFIFFSVIIVLMAVIGLIFFNNISKIEDVAIDANDKLVFALIEQYRIELARSALTLAEKVNIYVENYKNDIGLLSELPCLPELMTLADESGIKIDNRETEFDYEKQLANHYPFDTTGVWLEIYDYFSKIYDERDDEIDMIRIFHEDGYIINGVVFGEEDKADFKGDKSWFSETMDESRTRPNDYIISPISIARRTGTTAIRYTTPLEDLDGERKGLMVINFNVKGITGSIFDFKFGKSGYAMLLDKAYENAEGEILDDWVVVISQPTVSGEQYEIREGKDFASFITQEQLSGNSGLIEYNRYGKKWIAAYRRVDNPRRQWYVLTTVPVDETEMMVVGVIDRITWEILMIRNLFIYFSILVIVALILILIYVAWILENFWKILGDYGFKFYKNRGKK